MLGVIQGSAKGVVYVLLIGVWLREKRARQLAHSVFCSAMNSSQLSKLHTNQHRSYCFNPRAAAAATSNAFCNRRHYK